MHIYVHLRVFFFFFFFWAGGGGCLFFFGGVGKWVGGRDCCSCFRGCLGSHEDEVDPNQVLFTLAFDSDQVGPYSINATS